MTQQEPTPITEQEFKDGFVHILRNRLGGKPEPPELHQLEQKDASTVRTPEFRQLAATLLGQLPTTSTGSCTYIVIVQGMGRIFCIKNVTKAECDTLKGTFDPTGACNNPSWP